MPDLRIDRADLFGEPAQLLLDMRLGSRTVRLTDGAAVTVEARQTGVADLRFSTGLAPVAVDRVLELLVDDSSPRRASVQLAVSFDVADVVANGHSLYEATAELSQWYPTQSWEDRRVLIRGRLIDPAYGGQGEAFAFGIEESAGDDGASVPPDTWAVSLQNFPSRALGATGNALDVDSNIIGSKLPLVIGAPGQTPAVSVAGVNFQANTPASPGLLVERNAGGVAAASDYRIACGGGVLDVVNQGGTVTVMNLSDTSKWFTSAAATATDLLGQSFTYVNPDIVGNAPVEGDELWVVFDPDQGGGLVNPYGTGPLRRADHVIRWALEMSTLRIDRAQIPRLSLISGVNLDGYINGDTSPWAWLRDSILPLLPVSAVTGPDGLYIAVWNLNATQADAVVRFEEGRNCGRRAGVVSAGEIANRFTIRYAPNMSAGTQAAYRVFTGKRTNEELSDSSILPNYWCRRSQSLPWGVRDAGTIETTYVYEDASAEQILAWKARANSFPKCSTVLEMSRSFDWLRPGDVGVFTSTSLHLDGQPVFVESIAHDGGSLVAGVKWLEPLTFDQAAL